MSVDDVIMKRDGGGVGKDCHERPFLRLLEVMTWVLRLESCKV